MDELESIRRVILGHLWERQPPLLPGQAVVPPLSRASTIDYVSVLPSREDAAPDPKSLGSRSQSVPHIRACPAARY